MKNRNKFVWVSVTIGSILIAAVILSTVFIISGQKKNERYYDQIRFAKKYLSRMDFTEAVRAYKEAIELNPEESAAYIGLAQAYMDNEMYEDAYDIARAGFRMTRDDKLKNMLDLIQLARLGDAETEVVQNLVNETEEKIKKTNSEGVTARFDVINDIAYHCYQQYLDDYGNSTVEYVSKQEGYRMKFQRLTGCMYFQNTEENRNVVDEVTRQPAKNSKPYKVVFSDPSTLFVGYEGYISFERLKQLFGVDNKPVYDKATNMYYLNFVYMGCRFKIETDSEGNMYTDNPVIELSPVDLSKTDWVEETETEEIEDENTFVLGDETYSYSETEIEITGVELDDISPLAECKELKRLYLIDCGITDISPLAGCESLVELCLDYNPFTDISPLAGLKNLRFLQFHESGVSDISSIYNLDLDFFNPCSPGLDRKQVEEFKRRHPDCVCYWDYYLID